MLRVAPGSAIALGGKFNTLFHDFPDLTDEQVELIVAKMASQVREMHEGLGSELSRKNIGIEAASNECYGLFSVLCNLTQMLRGAHYRPAIPHLANEFSILAREMHRKALDCEIMSLVDRVTTQQGYAKACQDFRLHASDIEDGLKLPDAQKIALFGEILEGLEFKRETYQAYSIYLQGLVTVAQGLEKKLRGKETWFDKQGNLIDRRRVCAERLALGQILENVHQKLFPLFNRLFLIQLPAQFCNDVNAIQYNLLPELKRLQNYFSNRDDINSELAIFNNIDI